MIARTHVVEKLMRLCRWQGWALIGLSAVLWAATPSGYVDSDSRLVLITSILRGVGLRVLRLGHLARARRAARTPALQGVAGGVPLGRARLQRRSATVPLWNSPRCTTSPSSPTGPQTAASRYGRDVVRFNHRLAETGLFSDAALARLIERHPRGSRDICTMGENPPPGETWIAGEAEGLSGAELLQAVRTGALWVSCRGAMASDPEYRPVFDRLLKDFSSAAGARILSANASVLISGPRMGIYFHCDPTETMLWHVRGTKTINIYPRTDDYITEARMEAILLKENLADAPWRDEMAAGAHPGDAEPGRKRLLAAARPAQRHQRAGPERLGLG